MKLELIDEDERFRASLPFEHCYDEVKDVIKEACQFQLDAGQLVVNKLEAERDAAIKQVGVLARENGKYQLKVEELEAENKELKENIPTKEEAEFIIKHFSVTDETCDLYLNSIPLYIQLIAKLQKIACK
jgi:hypothetical protein